MKKIDVVFRFKLQENGLLQFSMPEKLKRRIEIEDDQREWYEKMVW